jgi:predicted HicB family RNase H-like nuclease
MTNPKPSAPSATPASEPNQRVLNIRISGELHRALLIYEAEHGLSHSDVVEAGLRHVLNTGVT